MKTSDRVLLGFGIGLACLILVTIVLVFTIGRDHAVLPSDTPEGTVQSYLLNIQEKNYNRAYSLLTPPQNPTDKPVPPGVIPVTPNYYDYWVNSAQNASKNSWKATLVRSLTTGDTATVEVLIEIFSPGGPFNNSIRGTTVMFTLKRSGSSWLITSPTDLYWIY